MDFFQQLKETLDHRWGLVQEQLHGICVQGKQNRHSAHHCDGWQNHSLNGLAVDANSKRDIAKKILRCFKSCSLHNCPSYHHPPCRLTPSSSRAAHYNDHLPCINYSNRSEHTPTQPNPTTVCSRARNETSATSHPDHLCAAGRSPARGSATKTRADVSRRHCPTNRTRQQFLRLGLG